MNNEVVVTSTATLTLQPGCDYTYTGSTTATWTLPSVAGNKNSVPTRITNRGLNPITLQRAGSDNLLHLGSTTTTYTVAVGTTTEIVNDGTYWIVTGFTYASTTAAAFGSLTLGTPLALNQGGTAATTAAGARTTLGLGTSDSPTFTGLTLSGGTVTTNTPLLNTTQTWNSAGTTFDGLKWNITNTASASSSLMLNCQRDTTTVFSVAKTGNLFLRNLDSQVLTLSWQATDRSGSMLLNGNNVQVNGGFMSFRDGPADHFTSTSSNGATVYWVLADDGTGIMAQRYGTNAQNFRIYNTYTGSNNEYLQIGFTSNTAKIDTVQTGTGTQRNLTLTAPAITLSGDVSIAGNISTTAGSNRQFTTNRSAVTDYARFMFQTGGTEMWAMGLRGDNGGSGVLNTFSITGNAGDSYPAVCNIIPGGSNYTMEIGSAHKLKASGKFSHGTAGALTIATGAITITKGYHTVDTEAAAATDDLDTINGGAEGDRLVLRAVNTNRTVVAKDGTGNLKLEGDCSLDNSEDTIELIHDGSNWLEIARSNNGA